MNNTNFDINNYVFKIAMIGDSAVGKTAFVLKYVEGEYIEDDAYTIGVDFKIKKFKINNNHIQLHIWDTAGQERFRTIIRNYYHNAHAIFLCFDITNKNSFLNLTYWYNELKKIENKKYYVIILGLKSDLARKRMVSHNEIYEFAIKHGLKYYEVSSKKLSEREIHQMVFIDVSLILIKLFPFTMGRIHDYDSIPKNINETKKYCRSLC